MILQLIVLFITASSVELENYTFPDWPCFYPDTQGDVIYNNETKQMFISKRLYKDSKCNQEVNPKLDPEANTCWEVGQCIQNGTTDLYYQMWSFRYFDKSLYWFYQDYFDNDRCEYTFFDEDSLDACEPVEGDPEEDYDKIILGKCHVSKMNPGLYARYYIDCLEEEGTFWLDFQTVYLGFFVLIPVFILALGVFFAFYTCQCGYLLYASSRTNLVLKRERNVDTELDAVEGHHDVFSDHLKHRKELDEHFKNEFDPEFRDASTIKLRLKIVWQAIYGTVVSIVMLLYLEIKNIFAIWFSVVCFLDSDVSKDDPFWPEKKTRVNNYQTIFTIVLIFYIVCAAVLLILWIKTHIISPLKVVVIYGIYQEWLIFRFLLGGTYIIYMWYGGVAFFDTNSEWASEVTLKFIQTYERYGFIGCIFTSDFINFLSFWFKFLSPELLLFVSFLQTIKYDGYSSINYYHRINRMKVQFPNVHFNIGAMFGTPDKNLSQLFLLLSIVVPRNDEQVKSDILQYRGSTDFGHLKWEMIKDLNAKEINFLKFRIFSIEDLDNIQERGEEEFNDIMFYVSPLRPVWWKALFLYVCCFRQKSKEEDVDEEKRKRMIEDSKQLIENIRVKKQIELYSRTYPDFRTGLLKREINFYNNEIQRVKAFRSGADEKVHEEYEKEEQRLKAERKRESKKVEKKEGAEMMITVKDEDDEDDDKVGNIPPGTNVEMTPVTGYYPPQNMYPGGQQQVFVQGGGGEGDDEVESDKSDSGSSSDSDSD